ncbi:MAG: hypothetical protein B7Z40_06105 [Bosea sp. 12-68-7]|nr:MAG: hypothetical protein B7Z40_06105 [Bosea sp. 12-68-7]
MPPRDNGGCDFALNPRLASPEAKVVWLLSVDPRVVQLLADTTESASMTLGNPEARLDRIADDGRHLLLGDDHYGAAAVIQAGTDATDPLMATMPLDRDLPLRVDALLRLWRIVTGQPPGKHQPELTPARSRRLSQALRAVDARGAGASRREIAQAVFGSNAVPDGVAFDDHHLKSRTGRLIRDGFAMIAGGYRKLLKP